jgi:TrmH family RNA methyltransferase
LKQIENYQRATTRQYQDALNLDNNPGEARLTARRKAEYRSLSRSKGRRELGQYLIEGVRSIESAISAGIALTDLVVLPDAADHPRIAALVAKARCPVWVGAAKDLASITDVRSDQGVVAAAPYPTDVGIHGGGCLVLDGVQDPGNVGTLIRTAAWFGIETVICGPDSADPYQPKVVRSSQGGLWDVTVVRRPTMEAVLADLAGRSVYVADMDGIELGEWEPPANAALVIGSEAHGPSAELKAVSEAAVTIPGSRPKGTESLNAAVAGGILLQHWMKVSKLAAHSGQ